MSFIKKMFGKKDEPITSYADFWNWFLKNEHNFYNIVKSQNDIEGNFFNKLTPKLAALKDGFYFLTGLLDKNTVELIFTAEGNIQNIVFVEELVSVAPTIKGWMFTALKPAMKTEELIIEMYGYKFDANTLFFFPNEQPECPDEIDISIVHDGLNEENRKEITNGVYVFLDNYLGELDFLNSIDGLKVLVSAELNKELIPLNKLKDYLSWRQKEFIEKYEGVRYFTENDEYSILQAELESGNLLIATMNKNLLEWDRKASHPWMAFINFTFKGRENGSPEQIDADLLNLIEDEIMVDLVDKEGYLNVGRQTADNVREIYFACKDFRKPSKVFYNIQVKYADKYQIEFDIFKDKYWKSFNRFDIQK